MSKQCITACLPVDNSEAAITTEPWFCMDKLSAGNIYKSHVTSLMSQFEYSKGVFLYVYNITQQPHFICFHYESNLMIISQVGVNLRLIRLAYKVYQRSTFQYFVDLSIIHQSQFKLSVNSVQCCNDLFLVHRFFLKFLECSVFSKLYL